jgi:hypothetical protein
MRHTVPFCSAAYPRCWLRVLEPESGTSRGRYPRSLPGLWKREQAGENCYLACAIAWLGGKRYMGTGSQIGFHAPFDPKTRLTRSGDTVVLVIYAAEMGFPYAAAKWISAKGPDEFNLLTKAEADRLGIEVEIHDATAPR